MFEGAKAQRNDMIYTITLNPARDRSLTIEGFAAGKVNRVREVRNDPGGKGINVSKAIQALGGSSVACAILGGEAGIYIEHSLAEMGIDRLIVHSKCETRTNIKISDPLNHTTTDINEPGHCDPQEAAQLFDEVEKRIQLGDLCVISGKLDVRAVDLAGRIQKLSGCGARVLLDTQGEALKIGVQASPFLIKPNDEELSELTGCAAQDEHALTCAAMALRMDCGIGIVALSLGARGALFVDEEGAWRAPGLRVDAVSTVGAGDTMMAALAYALWTGMDKQDMYRLALAAGAAAVGCPGSKSPSKAEIQALYEKSELWRVTI